MKNWIQQLKEKPYCSRAWYTPKRLLIGVLLLLSGFLLSILLLIGLVWFEVFGPLPDVQDLQHINQNFSSEIYTEDDQLLGRYYIENRSPVDTSGVGPYLLDALVSTEDERFFNHSGVDLVALGRVLVRTILLRDRSGGGGSTITQQLAKNLFPRRSYGVLTIPVIKIREMFIAARLEKVYSKNEILILYLNTVPFGNVYGIKVAAQQFFNKEPQDLNVQEAATLVGMLKANSTYNPVRNPEKSKVRRNIVLMQMARNNKLDSESLDSLKQLPLEVDYNRQSKTSGLAPHFRQYLKSEVAQILKEINKNSKKQYDLEADGLKIYTTIQADWQEKAEEAVQKHLKQLNQQFQRHWQRGSIFSKEQLWSKLKETDRYKAWSKVGLSKEQMLEKAKDTTEVTLLFDDKRLKMNVLDSIQYKNTILNTGFLVLDNATGAVRVWVGGADYQHSQYDRIRSKRPVGSTFKPIVYAAALQRGVPVCQYFMNQKVQYADYDNWMPENAGGEYGGYYTLAGGLKKSLNTVSVQVLFQASVDSVVQLAHAMGLESEIPQVPSIALGTSEHSLWEMIRPYHVLANEGRYTEPYFIKKIEDNEGVSLFEREDTEPQQVLNTQIAQVMRELLQKVVREGTALRLKTQYQVETSVAAKTGTTQNHSDGWFMGFTPSLTFGVWVGGDTPNVRFRSLGLGSGSNMALPIAANFLKKVEKEEHFDKYFHALPDSLTMQFQCPDFTEELPVVDTIPDAEQKIKKLIEDIKDIFEKPEEKQEAGNEKKEKKLKNIFKKIFGKKNKGI